MADTQSKLQQMRAKWLARFMNRFLVLRTSVGLAFFVLAFGFFTFFLRLGGDLGRIMIVVYGVLLILGCFALIVEYVLKTVNLQRETGFRSYSSILAVNTVFGFILPLIYTNIVLAVVIRSLSMMTYYGTFLCQARMSMVNFYYNNQIYTQQQSIIFWTVIMTLVLFLFGGLLERVFRR